MRLSFKAAARAASSMRLPRAVLTRKAPRIEKGEKKTKLNYVITYIHASTNSCIGNSLFIHEISYVNPHHLDHQK